MQSRVTDHRPISTILNATYQPQAPSTPTNCTHELGDYSYFPRRLVHLHHACLPWRLLQHLLVKSFSKRLSFVESCIHPHKAGSTFASPTNLDKDKMTCLSGSSHLVPVPGNHRSRWISKVVNVQTSNGNVLFATL